MTPQVLRLLFPKTAIWNAVRFGRVMGSIAATHYRLLFWPWLPK